MIEIGQGILIGTGIAIGNVIAQLFYFVTEDNNNLISEVGQDFIEE